MKWIDFILDNGDLDTGQQSAKDQGTPRGFCV